jgi:hypothetical protein
MFNAQLGLGGVNDALLNLEYGSVEKMTRAGSPWKTAYHGQKRFKERVSSAARQYFSASKSLVRIYKHKVSETNSNKWSIST